MASLSKLYLFLPQLPIQQIAELGLLNTEDEHLEILPLTYDWQTRFCQLVGYPQNDLPWSLLRAAQFNLDPNVKTICCCDPVMLQLTHRGAYMMGQTPLALSAHDAFKIVTHINEGLLDEGESLYLIDKYSWLFTSPRLLPFESSPTQALVGKDMFAHPYQGEHSAFWQRLATEIQMLIKQLEDYQGLPKSPPETIKNVHFFDYVNLAAAPELPFSSQHQVMVASDNDLLKVFCERSLINLISLAEKHQMQTSSQLLIAFDDERESYPEIINWWLETSLEQLPFESILLGQDGMIRFKPALNLWQSWSQKIKRVFQRDHSQH